VADPGHGHVDDAAAQAAGVHELAGQQEEWHRQQREVVGAVHEALRQDLAVKRGQCAGGRHETHQRQATDQQRIGNGHANGHGAQQAEHKDGDGHERAPGACIGHIGVRHVFGLHHLHQFVLAAAGRSTAGTAH
jgi:hypothetical protein